MLHNMWEGREAERERARNAYHGPYLQHLEGSVLCVSGCGADFGVGRGWKEEVVARLKLGFERRRRGLGRNWKEINSRQQPQTKVNHTTSRKSGSFGRLFKEIKKDNP